MAFLTYPISPEAVHAAILEAQNTPKGSEVIKTKGKDAILIEDVLPFIQEVETLRQMEELKRQFPIKGWRLYNLVKEAAYADPDRTPERSRAFDLITMAFYRHRKSKLHATGPYASGEK